MDHMQDVGHDFNGNEAQNRLPKKPEEIQPDLIDMEYSPYMDLFFPFIIHEEHRLSEQAVVLAGLSI